MKTLVVLLFLVCVFPEGAFAEARPSWWQQATDEAEGAGYVLLTPETLRALYGSGKSFLIVDVRAEYEYEAGHLPNAVSFEFDLGDKLQLKLEKRNQFLEMLGSDMAREIVFYCRSFR